MDGANVYIDSNLKSKVTNVLRLGQKVNVLTEQNGFSRISKYYDGESKGVKGQVAEWVKSDSLSSEPLNNVVISGGTELEKVLQSSDDYQIFREKFIQESQKLIDAGKCKLSDFKEMG